MAQSSFATWLRKLTVQAQGSERTDRELLDLYSHSRDPDALETLVYRYAGLVHSVCRRILNDPADIDDAVQAVFLVLMKKPHAVRNPGALPAWLHGTARRVSLNLRARNQRRATATTEPCTTDVDPHWREVRCCIDEELAALPSKYRNALFRVLLLEETQQQAATELGISLSTLKRRVEIGRSHLQNRLTRRGIQPLLLAGSLTIADKMSAANLARLADQTTTTVATSATALSLANGVLFTMFQTKLKLWAIGVMLTGVTLGTGAGLVSVQGQGTPGTGGVAAGKSEVKVDDALVVDISVNLSDLEVLRAQVSIIQSKLLALDASKSTDQKLRKELETKLNSIEKLIKQIEDKFKAAATQTPSPSLSAREWEGRAIAAEKSRDLLMERFIARDKEFSTLSEANRLSRNAYQANRLEELTYTIEKSKLRRDAAKSKIMAAERVRSVNSVSDSEKTDALIRIYDAQLELLTADHDQKNAERELAEIKKAPMAAERVEVPAKVAAPVADKLAPEVKAKLEEMVACAKEEFKWHKDRMMMAADIDVESYYASLSRVVCSELQLAGTTMEQRLAIRKQQLEYCKEMEEYFKRRVQAQIARPQSYERAKFARMEVELLILQLQQK